MYENTYSIPESFCLETSQACLLAHSVALERAIIPFQKTTLCLQVNFGILNFMTWVILI